jgi:hypothetical protein
MFNQIINIPNDSNLYPKKIERYKDLNDYDKLYNIYKTLFIKMDKFKFIEII